MLDIKIENFKDLSDGGSEHFAKTVRLLKKKYILIYNFSSVHIEYLLIK